MRRVGTRERVGMRERGAGTVLVVGAIALLLVLTYAASVLVAAAVASTKAASAADLAGLSAAARAQGGSVDGCAVAREVVAANGADLVSCLAVGDGSFEVSTVVAMAVTFPGAPTRASGRSRAGPANLASTGR